MNGRNEHIPSVYVLSEYLKSNKFIPVYFLFGEDAYAIRNAAKSIEKAVLPLIVSDFDIEKITVKKGQNISEIIDLAYTFPFGSEKKLLIVQNFERFGDKKKLVDYIKNPSETTVLVLLNMAKIKNLNQEPYISLFKRNFIFEAKILKGKNLVAWLTDYSKTLGLEISAQNAMTLIELVGDDKSLIEMQLQKIGDYLNGKGEITIEIINSLTSVTKEYTFFDLQDALSVADKGKALKVLYNILEQGKDLVSVNGVLARYISTIAKSRELMRNRMLDKEAAKACAVSEYYYRKCKNAKFFQNDRRLLKAARALFNCEIAIKTSAIDQKTIGTILISELTNSN